MTASEHSVAERLRGAYWDARLEQLTRALERALTTLAPGMTARGQAVLLVQALRDAGFVIVPPRVLDAPRPSAATACRGTSA